MTSTTAEIGPEMRMQDLLAAFPGARRALFRRYHIGGCSSCGFQLEESLRQVCERNNRLDCAEVLAHIRESHTQDAHLLIEPRELDELLRRDPSVKLVDIRSRPEWNTTHLPSATLLSQDLMQEIMSRWPKEAVVVIYDHSGAQGLDAAAYFSGHGLTNVRSLRGGIDAWAAEVDSSIPRYQLQRGTA